MKDVTLNNGTTMTDTEFIKKYGLGDAPTDFVATKDDLGSLANGIVDDLIAAEFYLKICVGRRDIPVCNYISNRLTRLVDYLPELDEMVRERLRLGREKNEKYLKEEEANANAASAGGEAVNAKRKGTRDEAEKCESHGKQHRGSRARKCFYFVKNISRPDDVQGEL